MPVSNTGSWQQRTRLFRYSRMPNRAPTDRIRIHHWGNVPKLYVTPVG